MHVQEFYVDDDVDQKVRESNRRPVIRWLTSIKWRCRVEWWRADDAE